MKRKTSIIWFVVLIVVLFLSLFIIYSYFRFIDRQDKYLPDEIFTIANWNLQIFGDKKANDTQLMNLYAEKISHYDIIFLQEIRDKDGNAFKELCDMLPDYSCLISTRAGRSSSKEQYGIVYLKKYTITLIDYNPDILDRWERPPIRADVYYQNYSLSIYNIHTKPDNVSQELGNLEGLVDTETNARNIMVLGDLNADCYYYNPYSSSDFKSWSWIIKDNADTTSGNSDCAYDRIIMNPDAYNEYVRSGIDNVGIGEDVSDHYLVWVLIRDHDYQKDKTFKGYIHNMFYGTDEQEI